MSKIFGVEHFIDNTMIKIVEDFNKQYDDLVFRSLEQQIRLKMPDVVIDEQKLRDWIVLCMKLENINKSDLIDIAVKKKFADKDEELAIYKRALELARLDGLEMDDYIVEAKKELEEQECVK